MMDLVPVIEKYTVCKSMHEFLSNLLDMLETIDHNINDVVRTDLYQLYSSLYDELRPTSFHKIEGEYEDDDTPIPNIDFFIERQESTHLKSFEEYLPLEEHYQMLGEVERVDIIHKYINLKRSTSSPSLFKSYYRQCMKEYNEVYAKHVYNDEYHLEVKKALEELMLRRKQAVEQKEREEKEEQMKFALQEGDYHSMVHEKTSERWEEFKQKINRTVDIRRDNPVPLELKRRYTNAVTLNNFTVMSTAGTEQLKNFYNIISSATTVYSYEEMINIICSVFGYDFQPQPVRYVESYNWDQSQMQQSQMPPQVQQPTQQTQDTKQCCKCREVLPIEMFRKNGFDRNKNRRYRSNCKKCGN